MQNNSTFKVLQKAMDLSRRRKDDGKISRSSLNDSQTQPQQKTTKQPRSSNIIISTSAPKEPICVF